MIEGLRRLRVQLTAWYIGVFAVLLVGFGAALLAVVARESSRQLDRSLRKAADALAEAAGEHDGEEAGVPEAVRELHIPDRVLYLFGPDGRPLHPDTAAEWIQRLATDARTGGARLVERDLPAGRTERAYAAAVALPGGERRVVVVGGESLEIDHQYPGLLLAFGTAAAAALLLAGLGGWVLARRSIQPVDAAFTRMRRFMADAAHELRTPVAVVKGHADVALRRERAPQEYVETLSAIRAETERLRGLLANVLTLATADAGAWPERRESLFLDDVLLDAASAARVLADERQLRLDMEALDELPVRGDPELLRQLLMILLDNAIKFTPPEGTIRLRAVRSDGVGRVSIEDTGPGMSDEALAHAFERFYRADPARGRSPGAGLGLPIARWIAESHGGTVELSRSAAGGTIATVTLPVEGA